MTLLKDLFGVLYGKSGFFLNDYNLKIDNINETDLISNLRLIMDKELAYTKNIPTIVKTEKIIKNKRFHINADAYCLYSASMKRPKPSRASSKKWSSPSRSKA